MTTIPDRYDDLFERETLAHFATVLPDGAPHVVPVWVDRDDDHLLVNTVRGTRKERNVRQDRRVALSLVDPDDPNRFLAVRGEVVTATEDGAVEHVNRLARRYMDVEEYPRLGEESGPRLLLRIRPDEVTTSE
ncbi:PPOX class F420-dependent oxidoreductase [Halomicrococcus sp. NG-SE-24]|uniref:PPOX class F420-dependent oxidoreductase n=1 Tax=unclassified Halomicrococcus TaxID=2614448 RepID=UPI003D992B89